MKFNFIFSISVACMSIQAYNATVLVKFGKVASFFKKSMEKGYPGTDPLKNFGLRSRQMLCDAAINAKQFTSQYNPAYYEGRPRGTLNSLAEWDAPDDITVHTINYQKYDFEQDLYLSSLSYQTRPVMLGKKSWWIKSVQCVNTMTVKWFLTFGFEDKFMFLLEVRTDKKNASLRVAGIFEPSAVIDNRGTEYFYSQIRSAKGLLESICNLPYLDMLRACSVVFDALNTEGSLKRPIERLNHLKRERRPCVEKSVKVSDDDGEFVVAHVLRGSIFRAGTASDEFYVLADSRERESVFVLFAQENGMLKLHARITKIGALINPTGWRKEKLQTEQSSEEKGKFDQESLEEYSENTTESDDVKARTHQRESSKKRKTFLGEISPNIDERETNLATKTRSKKSFGKECKEGSESITGENRRVKFLHTDDGNAATRVAARHPRKSKESVFLADEESDIGSDNEGKYEDDEREQFSRTDGMWWVFKTGKRSTIEW